MQHETRARDTKAEIHQAALGLFSTRGYEKTSLREIAEQVGITKASLYYHYSSKQDLLKAIIGSFFEDLNRMLVLVDELSWSPQAEREMLGAYLDVVIMHRVAGPLVLRDVAAVLAAFGDDLDGVVLGSRAFHTWLAGPDPTPGDRVLAAAAVEVIGAVMSSGMSPTEVSDEELRAVLLDAATAVLSRRQRTTTKV